MSLEILTSDTLAPVRHGFFTRRGGASSGVFAGLNCGMGSSDQRDIVSINRDRAAEAMGVPRRGLRFVRQVHSARAIHVRDETEPAADAHVSDDPDLALAILTADCMPILLADSDAGVAGAAHAGWRGALDGVIEATVVAMEELGARRDRIAAVIGPVISQENYEVGPDLYDAFITRDAGADRFFERARGDRLRFDLPGYGLHRLETAGLARTAWIGTCTYADTERFYSYRRSTHRKEADYGRLISVIRPARVAASGKARHSIL